MNKVSIVLVVLLSCHQVLLEASLQVMCGIAQNKECGKVYNSSGLLWDDFPTFSLDHDVHALVYGYKGGRLAAHVPALLSSKMNDAHQVSTEIFADIDHDLKRIESDTCTSGAGLLVCSIDCKTQMMHLANIGESRAVLFDAHGLRKTLVRKKKSVYTPEDESSVTLPYGMQVRASLGDFSSREAQLVSYKVRHVSHPIGDDDRVLVMATPQFWRYVSRKRLGKLIDACSSNDPQSIATSLMEHARGRALKKDQDLGNVHIQVLSFAHKT